MEKTSHNAFREVGKKSASVCTSKITTTNRNNTIIILYMFCYCLIIKPFRFISLIKIIWLIRWRTDAIDCTTTTIIHTHHSKRIALIFSSIWLYDKVHTIIYT